MLSSMFHHFNSYGKQTAHRGSSASNSRTGITVASNTLQPIQVVVQRPVPPQVSIAPTTEENWKNSWRSKTSPLASPSCSKTLTGVSSAFKEFREDQDLAKIRTNYIVIARFNGPRNSNELYTYLFPKQMNLSEVKSTLQLRGPKENANCIEGAGETQPPFPRIRSQEDNPKRPLHGLTKVSTDGFAQGSAFIHPFFDTRLSQVFDAVDRQQNWQWNFDWNGRSYNFESYPPGYMASLDLIDGSNRTPLGNRQLGNVVPSYDVSARPFSLAPSILFPTEIASYQLTVKSANASRTLLRCDYTIDQQFLTVPAALYQKLAAGEYLVTVTLETNQIHFKDGGSYPPWLITAQDWVHFKINKKL
jgi:hypothetical protein